MPQIEVENGTATSFDRKIGALKGLPDVIASKPTTTIDVEPISGSAKTFIVQTFRQRDGDRSLNHVFVQYIDGNTATRIYVPPRVADVIAQQRDALIGRARSRTAKNVAAERMASGKLPGFMKNRKRRGK